MDRCVTYISTTRVKQLMQAHHSRIAAVRLA
ncbi:hypothetical protein HNR39_002984 [Glaciimonas immobilis]|uniref:Uncharacterized protein n=1 Tax=Glaciimonas immobilis TaxID=728004 RepID=A0A840RTI6_9BURK|nr:hypothetical protein [Glaciimonas immobilis]